MSKKRVSIKKPRTAAYYRQNGLCFYCFKPMWLHSVDEFASTHSISIKQANHFQCTGEHLAAHSEGGNAPQKNIVAACKFCNLKRHARSVPPDPGSFANLVHRRLAKGAWNSHLLSSWLIFAVGLVNYMPLRLSLFTEP